MTTDSKRVSMKALKRYPLDSFTLIPLHHYLTKSKRHGRVTLDGKRPVDSNWTKRKYNSPRTLALAERNGLNVGVRLTDEQLVLDIDPRNGGEEGFASFCADLGIDPDKYPHVITGSGGHHYYMSKPADILVLDTLEDYPGVEFKSKGRQVVAAGSIHPETKKHYVWAKDSPSIESMPRAPKNLLRIIARPERSTDGGEGGKYSAEELHTILSGIDPCDFNTNDKWTPMLMACHHATAGEGRQEFIDWSTSDPAYRDDGYMIGRRWDSLHKERGDGYTSKTLEYHMRKNGLTNLQKANDAVSDFSDEADELPASRERKTKKPNKAKLTEFEDEDEGDEFESGFEEEDDPDYVNTEGDESPLKRLNEEYCAVMAGSKFRIAQRQFEPMLNRSSYVFIAQQDFTALHQNRKMERAKEYDEKGKEIKHRNPKIDLGSAWLKWGGRRTVKGVVFDPVHKVHDGYLNLWQGWPFEPSTKGSWEHLKTMIREVICHGDEEQYQYVLNWIRFMFQKPNIMPEVAIVLYGDKGTGKSTLGNVICKLIGQHSMNIVSSELLVGRFNSHLRDLLFLFADEAVKPYDKTAESRLKALITESNLAYEGKGADASMGKNYAHVLMASNDEWVVPASKDERRFYVTRVNNSWLGKHDKFRALYEELERDGNSGYRRMLFDMLNDPLPENFHPRQYPVTQALINQKRFSQKPLSSFFYDMCAMKQLTIPHHGDWETGRVWFFVEEFREFFKDWCKKNNINPAGSGRGDLHHVLGEIKAMFPTSRTDLRRKVPDDSTVHSSPSDGRAPVIELPGVEECRRDFDHAMGGKGEWNDSKKESEFG